MAKKDKSNRLFNLQKKNINKLVNGINNNMDELYKKTYSSIPSMKNDLNNLADDINSALDKITKTNQNTVGVPNTSKLYNRIMDVNGIKSNSNFIQQTMSMLQDSTAMDDLYQSFMQNYILKEMDDEIDAVCKYMPKLLEALETRKDNVLSADHFSKDFITIKSDNISNERGFNSEIDNLKETYKLPEFVEELYDNASRYGEEFVYIVPYQKAMQRLLAKKPAIELGIGDINGFRESCIDQGIDYDKSVSILESTGYKSDDKSILSEVFIGSKNIKIINESYASPYGSLHSQSTISNIIGNSKNIDKNPNFKLSFKVEINKSNIIESVLSEQFKINKQKKYIKEQSIWETVISEKKGDIISKITYTDSFLSYDGMKDENEKHKKKNDTISYDGLVSGEYATDPDKIKITIPGAVLKKLDHTMVKPIYIDDTNMGYFYVEALSKEQQSDSFGFTSITGDPLTAGAPGRAQTLNNAYNAEEQDKMIKYISSQLSQYIDANFVNANPDLRNEIYTILKNNDIFNSNTLDRLKVTFIPPDEMIHVCFRRHPITNRGISDLDRAMVPAKIYSALYIAQSIGALTRGQDKRVYYVKQEVETNIARTLLNTIQQIKLGNFGMRQFKSINSVLNITGRFNDYVIPTNSSGEAPIQFEVMQGQQFDVKTELLDILEEMAVNSTDVPLELIQARMSMDYATHYTMSSIKFLRKVYKRQSQFQVFITDIFRKLYLCEYGKVDKLKATLPPPVFLNITNTSQVIDNTDQFVEKIVTMDLGDNADAELKNTYKRELMNEYLGTYINIERNKTILEKCKLITKSNSTGEEDGGY